MAVATVQFFSKSLEHPVSYTLITPEVAQVGPGPYDVLVQLHGRYDSHTAWLYKSNLARYVEGLPLIVVLPDGGNHYWSNLDDQHRYEDLVVSDLWEHLRGTLAVRQERRWAIGGLSMGGYGAIRLGLKHPDKFCSIYAHSSFIPSRELLDHWDLVKNPELAADMDCVAWASRLEPVNLPRLSFDCGLEDGLLEQNRAFRTHLKKLNLPHFYAEYPGAHTWDYWDEHVPAAIAQHIEVLGLTRVTK